MTTKTDCIICGEEILGTEPVCGDCTLEGFYIIAGSVRRKAGRPKKYSNPVTTSIKLDKEKRDKIVKKYGSVQKLFDLLTQNI